MTGSKWLTGAALVVSVLALTTGGIALASASHRSRSRSRATKASVSVTDAIGAFRSAPLTDSTDVATEQALTGEFGSIATPIGEADFSAAHPAPISGRSSQVWIAPSGNDVCTYIPDPVNGWGGGCYPVGTVEAGEAYSIMGGPNAGLGDNVIVAVVVSDGGPAPQLVAPNGTTSTLAVSSNVAAALVPADDSLKVGAQTIDLSVILHPTKVRFVG
ncbi:MAG TPA: hypothetical protein VIH92_13970 [Solirubrobacteraceae bacterium]|jgi:hypothetical protein